MSGPIVRGSATHLTEGAVPQRSPILGFPSIYAYTLLDADLPNFDVVTSVGRGLIFCRRTTKFDTVTYVGEERVYWGQRLLLSLESGVTGMAFRLLEFSSICPYNL